MTRNHRILPLFSLLLTVACASPALAMDAIWVSSPSPYASEEIRLTVTAPAEAPGGSVVRLNCLAESRRERQGLVATLQLLDAAGATLAENQIPLHLYRGKNHFHFDIETAALPVGQYTAALALPYSEQYAPAAVSAPLRRVSSTSLNETLARLEARLEQLSTLSAGAPADARLSLCREILGMARADQAASRWPQLVAKTDYLEAAANRIAAGMVFAGSAGPDRLATTPGASPISLGPQGFQGEGGPVFPLGLSLSGADPSQIDRARRLGCQWVTLDLGPADIARPDGSLDLAALEATLGRARELGMAVTARLRPDRLGPEMLQRYPNIAAKGFVDIAHPDARVLFEQHAKALLPLLERHGVAAVELMAAPRFQFEEERFRQLFVEHIERIYPDRINLNRAWHSHLADYSEITLKGEFEHSYQNRRAFQYDWQSFHRSLALQYVDWAVQLAASVAPGVPRYVTYSEDLFGEGAARIEPNREEGVNHFMASGVSASVSRGDGVYICDYPGQTAVAALTKSFAPDKPLLVSDYLLGRDAATPNDASLFAQTRTAMWQLAMSGADGVALDPQSPWLDDPNALEALLTARAEINAWGPVLNAFQQAPIEIGILYSNSSKLFDDGEPHLESAHFAFEGASFSGHKTGFITESQCVSGALANLPVLIIPDTPALSDEAFQVLAEHVQGGAAVARTGRPIPYNEHGVSRHDVVRNTGNTVLVRGLNLPTEYLHAMDAHIDRGSLGRIPRPVNGFGFPLEGVFSRYVEHDGQPYLYLVSLRKDSVDCYLAGGLQTGANVLLNQQVRFPLRLVPLEPMLIALDRESNAATLAAAR